MLEGGQIFNTSTSLTFRREAKQLPLLDKLMKSEAEQEVWSLEGCGLRKRWHIWFLGIFLGGWWFHVFFSLFSGRKLGKMFTHFWRVYFWNGLVQPPTSFFLRICVVLVCWSSWRLTAAIKLGWMMVMGMMIRKDTTGTLEYRSNFFDLASHLAQFSCVAFVSKVPPRHV